MHLKNETIEYSLIDIFKNTLEIWVEHNCEVTAVCVYNTEDKEFCYYIRNSNEYHYGDIDVFKIDNFPFSDEQLYNDEELEALAKFRDKNEVEYGDIIFHTEEELKSYFHNEIESLFDRCFNVLWYHEESYSEQIDSILNYI